MIVKQINFNAIEVEQNCLRFNADRFVEYNRSIIAKTKNQFDIATRYKEQDCLKKTGPVYTIRFNKFPIIPNINIIIVIHRFNIMPDHSNVSIIDGAIGTIKNENTIIIF